MDCVRAMCLRFYTQHIDSIQSTRKQNEKKESRANDLQKSTLVTSAVAACLFSLAFVEIGHHSFSVCALSVECSRSVSFLRTVGIKSVQSHCNRRSAQSTWNFTHTYTSLTQSLEFYLSAPHTNLYLQQSVITCAFGFGKESSHNIIRFSVKRNINKPSIIFSRIIV